MNWRSILCFVLAVTCCVLGVRFASTTGDSFATAPDIAWAAPSNTALHNLGPADPGDLEKFQPCTSLTYRMIDDLSKTMRTGCFIETSFGRIDPDKSIVIFNNSDEAEYIKDGSRLPALSVPPHSGNIAVFGGFPTVGSYMYLYSDFYGALQTAGSPLLGGRYKNIGRTPDLVIRDASGQPLNVNPLAFSYAPRSQWFVTEVPNKALARVNMATLSVIPFAPALNTPGQPRATQAAAMAVTASGRYAAIASGEFKTLRIYDLKNCGAASGNDPLEPQNCRSHDYWQYIEEQVSGTVQSIGQLSFSSDGLLSFNVKTASSYETYLLSPNGPITSLIPYLGLGDSYGSGQGAFNYLAGTDTSVNKCHLSVHSYPLLLNRDLFSGRGNSVACSGARSHDVSSESDSYRGQNGDQIPSKAREADGSEVTIIHNFTTGALAQQRFVTSYQPGAITLQIGGNDIGFSTMLMRCLSPLTLRSPPRVNVNSCYQSYEDRLEIVQSVNRTYPKLVSLYKQLSKQSPASQLYIIGYPHILSPKAECRGNVRLTLAEITFAREVTIYINSVIQKAATAAGATYVDISDALSGRELCSGGSGTIAVNGLTAGDDKFGLGQESFHPTAHGHELIAQAIMQKTHNLTSATRRIPVTGGVPVINANEPLLQAPSTGRQVGNISHQAVTNSRLAGRGQSITISVDGETTGLKPGSPFQVTTGGVNAGSLTSGGDGTISGTVTIPPSTPDGNQPVIITGPGQGDNPVTIIDVIYVPVTPEDSDGDGIPNTTDPCPLVAGDCDTLGSEPPADSGPPTNTPIPTPSGTTSSPTLSNLQGSGVTVQSASQIGNLPVRLGAVKARSMYGASVTRPAAVLGKKTMYKPVEQPAQAPLAIFYWYIWLGLLTATLLIASWPRQR